MKSNSYNRKGKTNPALVQAKLEASLQKKLHDAHYQGVMYSTIVMKLISYMILSDKFNFTNDQLQVFRENINEVADSLTKDYISVNDMLKLAKEEFGIKLSVDDLCIIDPEFKAITDDD